MPARNIRYSSHLELRVKLRAIPRELPRTVYLGANRRFLDASTGFFIVVHTLPLGGKRREIAVVYRETEREVLLVTIHSLKARQVQNRLASGRWREIPLDT